LVTYLSLKHVIWLQYMRYW